MSNEGDEYLKRLPPEYYRGFACVHWSLSIQDRRTGWLMPTFYYKFREVLTHTMFRYRICCPIFCLMPDHMHILWLGMSEVTDQRTAMKFFRRQLNTVLGRIGFQLQQQGFDNVLKESELERTAFQCLVEYIARNPERKKLVAEDHFSEYKYSGCLLPGYPDLTPFRSGFWDLWDRICSQLRKDFAAPGTSDADPGRCLEL